MMINIPSAPGGAAAADAVLPGAPTGGARPAPADAEGAADGALAALFGQMLDFAGLAAPADGTVPAAPARRSSSSPVRTTRMRRFSRSRSAVGT